MAGNLRFLANMTGSGGTLQKLLEDLPADQTMRLKVIAANDGGEVPESSEVKRW